MKHNIFFLVIGVLLVQYSFSQTCVDCEYSSAIASSSTIGRYNTSLGTGSVIIGINSQTGDLASNSIAMGSYVKTIAGLSFVIGHGINSSYMLENNMNRTLMVGFNSNLPTFFVSRSIGLNTTGKIAIGNVVNEEGFMDPQTKLHLRADESEIAAMLIEPYSWAEGSGGGGSITGNKGEVSVYENGAYLFLGNSNHGIGAVSDLGLLFNSESNYIFGEGKVGINTSDPDYTLHVNGDINFTGSLYEDGELFKTSPWIESGENIVYQTGKVGIGTTNFVGNYGLYVNNGILTSEVMVLAPSVWYDFVFENNYSLMSLPDLESYINTNKKLPDVPSEKEVTENGYGLAEMNGILLKKVEELTLYILEQQKQIDALSKKVDNLNK